MMRSSTLINSASAARCTRAVDGSGYAASQARRHAEFEHEEAALIFRRIAKNANRLNVLKACLVKMDDLPPRRRELSKRLKL
jgi:hypothetical protein